MHVRPSTCPDLSNRKAVAENSLSLTIGASCKTLPTEEICRLSVKAVHIFIQISNLFLQLNGGSQPNTLQML